ncbi:MAG TPA: LLM class flavin-dependent oxidoreductase [Nitrososphaerales archaeon]|nr:LLM class flavin-dependent oxidoreductase [Nitrososphaerales archaeon]
MKFGYQQPAHDFPEERQKDTFHSLAQIARECESLGYDSFWLMDHLIQIELAGKKDAPILEPYVSLSAIASLTSTIKLGALCTCNIFRSPALVAKMGVTLDQISRGRFWLGIGAGWYQEEARMYGYGFPAPPDRLSMLEESVKIIKDSWSRSARVHHNGSDPGNLIEDSGLTFHGRFYGIENFVVSPPPVQRPHPPILIGGGGEKVTLGLVSKYADACNFFPKGAALERKLRLLKQRCMAEGRDYSSILKTKLATVMFGGDEQDALQKISRYKPRSMSLASYALSTLLGTPAQMVREIEGLNTIGIDYLIVNFRGKYSPEDKKKFSEEVMSSF